MENEKPIHYLKARKSDFLASIDLDIFELEGKSNTLKIKEVQYKENFKVNGKIRDKGVIIYFEESHVKPFICNITNCTIIKQQTGVNDARNWKGFSLVLRRNFNVSMRVSKTETRKSGISVKSVLINGLVPPLENIEDRIKKCNNKVSLMEIWIDLNEQEQQKYLEIFTNQRTLLEK